MSRITPAYAGNTKRTVIILLQNWDHPRLRGEHFANHGYNTQGQGSPPPTRGTLYSLKFKLKSSRITPAYAGNTLKVIYLTVFQRDHPRLRGEHDDLQKYFNCTIGSPPPTRGTPDKFKKKFPRSRITPAYAGNTTKFLGTL